MFLRHLFALLVVSLSQTCFCQVLTDPTLNVEFAHHVKSIDEFVQRFNGIEEYPGLNKSDKDFRKKNLFSLFDRDMDPAFKKHAIRFSESVLNNKVYLNFCDSNWFSVVTCEVSYKGKKSELNLILRPVCEDSRHRWFIAGVSCVSDKLLPECAPIGISGVEHEVGFIELSSIFHNDIKNITGYVDETHKVDQLSVFLTLVATGQLKFEHVVKQIITFYQVPGYVFTIEEIGRKGVNAGWLITNFSEVSEGKKSEHIKQLLGI